MLCEINPRAYIRMEKAETERNLLESVVARKLGFFGHIVRKTADCLEKEIMEGSLPGKEHGEDQEQLGRTISKHGLG